jgi:hypothetical protein
VPDRAYTDADLDAAIAAITDPQRLHRAQEIVARVAPSLQRVLAAALEEGGWFDAGHDQAVREAATIQESQERIRAVRTLLAEETRLGMLVGVAVGFELARELGELGAPSELGDPGDPGEPGELGEPGEVSKVQPTTKED